MPLSVTITYPMPQAMLTPSFQVCGTAIVTERKDPDKEVKDRNYHLLTTPSIEVTVTKGPLTFGPFIATPCPGGGGWEASVHGIPPDTGYTVTATIRQGATMVSHSIEWVDVEIAPLLPFSVICCSGGGGDGGNRVKLLPLGTLKTPVSFKGVHMAPGADEIFGVPWTIDETVTVASSPGGGTHYAIIYHQGYPIPGSYGSVNPATNEWEIIDIEVDAHTFVVFYLKREG